MPTAVNSSVEDELCPGSSVDMGGRLYTVNSNVDVYQSPPKRARISAPFTFGSLVNEQDRKSSVKNLPDECLYEIFRRLSSGKERSSCACVSKRWLMLVSSISKDEIASAVEKTSSDKSDEDVEGDCDGCLTRNLEGKKATDVRLAAIAVGTSSCGGLGKLSIRGNNSVRGVTDCGLSAVARGCPSLRSLSLWNVSSIGDKGLCEIAKRCHLLEKLDLCHSSSITNKSLIAIAEGCPNLTSLNIESCSMIGNEGLQAVARLCPNLHSIAIKNCPLVGDHGVSSLLSSASNLSRVKLQALNITDFSLAVIGHYGNQITNLILNDLRNVNERGFWVMGVAQGLHKLVSLTITSCQGVTDVSIGAMGNGCPNLKHLCLRKCCFVSDIGLVAFAQSARSLENLHLEECNRFTQCGIIGALLNIKTKLKSLTLVKCMGIKDIDVEVSMLSSCDSLQSLVIKTKLKSLTLVKCMGIKDIDVEVSMLSSCDSLQSLVIQHCPGFSSASMAIIGKLCPQLQHVDLTGLYGITDGGLLPLLENNEAGLVKVNFRGCWNLTDETVSALARLHGGTLEILNLDGCWNVTDESLVAIADNCLLLNDLDVSKCAITDAGIAVLSDAIQLSLQVLSMSGCSDVSNKCVPYLMKLGQTLLGLNIQNCNAIGSNTIEFLMENLWRCEILA